MSIIDNAAGTKGRILIIDDEEEVIFKKSDDAEPLQRWQFIIETQDSAGNNLYRIQNLGSALFLQNPHNEIGEKVRQVGYSDTHAKNQLWRLKKI